QPALGRRVLLSRCEETLEIGDRQFALSTSLYRGAVHPNGFELIEHFELSPFPKWIYSCGEVRLEKRLFMPHGRDAVVVSYRLLGGATQARMRLTPLMVCRDIHSLGHERTVQHPGFARQDGRICLNPFPKEPAVFVFSPIESVEQRGVWFYQQRFPIEAYQGMDFEEDLFSPLDVIVPLRSTEATHVVFTLEENFSDDPEDLARREEKRREGLFRMEAPPEIAAEDLRLLELAADQFIVRRKDGLLTILAGYPWFTDWGRDTMIALPGLTLTTRRFDEAREILLTFCKYCSQGMLPNMFPDSGGEPAYNTADASLWFFNAVRHYSRVSGDQKTVRRDFYPIMREIVEWHLRGTRFNIRVGEDGLVTAGQEGHQLTWMDAKVEDWVVTPRWGKPVEISALWFNALQILAEFANAFGDDQEAKRCATAARATQDSFCPTFWNEKDGCLFDVVDGSNRDPAFRPNQLFALSLPHAMLSAEDERKVFRLVTEHLLTPFGLRSLSGQNAGYKSRYGGDRRARDGAYHQGTVWAWLIGPYVDALLKVMGRSAATRAHGFSLLRPLLEHLKENGIGTVAEIFDGNAPHAPRGCPAQAWSVAEILRSIENLSCLPKS
ncbi:MAG: amylo-alpha-1,6-glucosidase, partial [bacterium]